jgi:2-C-methyl-D-erythritol 4-phosphate cytidylyltransferase
MEKYAVIVAGGSGLRMGAALPKQFLLLRNKPVLWHTLTAFLTAFDDLQIVLVLPEAFIETGASIAGSTITPGRIQITPGGSTRFHSVKNGLALINKPSVVFIHDGVRCLITPALVRSCYFAAVEKGNAIPAITAMDTIRIVTENGSSQVDRNKVRLVQTPQTFLSGIIKAAYEQDFTESFTDEASVAEKQGVNINLVEGEITNIKITRPADLLFAEKILEQRELNPDNLPGT